MGSFSGRGYPPFLRAVLIPVRKYTPSGQRSIGLGPITHVERRRKQFLKKGRSLEINPFHGRYRGERDVRL